jgi:Flp pilus assembly protein TadG
MFSLLRTPLWRPFRRIAEDTRGISAVEFALILPVMLTIYLGGNELSHALTIARKVTHVTSSLGDLVTQSKVLSATDVDKIFDAAKSIMTPYATTADLFKIKLSGVRIDNNGKAWVDWSRALQDTPLTQDAPFNGLPAGVLVPNTHIVAAEVHYSYKPMLGYTLTGTFDLQDQFYLRPRLSESVCYPTAPCT